MRAHRADGLAVARSSASGGLATRTLQTALGLALSFAVAAWLARAALPRSTVPFDLALNAFGFPTCPLPCWAGIDVGRTPFERASAQIAAILTMPQLNIMTFGGRIAVDASMGEERFSAQVVHNGGLVGALRLRIDIPLVHLIDWLGPPTCGSSKGGMAIIWLVERSDQTIGVIAALDRAVLDGIVHELWIAPAHAHCAANNAHPWRGFGPNWLYR